jgi:hypothetical protein
MYVHSFYLIFTGTPDPTIVLRIQRVVVNRFVGLLDGFR